MNIMPERTDSIMLDPSTESVLVVRLKALGDIVLSLPLVNSLRRSFPEARIDYLCLEGYGEATGENRDLDSVIEFRKGILSQAELMLRLRRTEYDLAIDLISSPRSSVITLFSGADMRIGMDVGRHNFCYHKVLPRTISRNGRRVRCYTMDANREIARMLNLKSDQWADSDNMYRIDFATTEGDRKWTEELLSGTNGGVEGYIGIVPAAKYEAKRWPLESFSEFVKMLTEQTGYIPVMIWGPGEEETVDYIVRENPGALKPPLIGISRLGGLIGRMDCLVGVDSGPKHLAVIQGVPTLTLFGPTDPEVWDPMTERHRVIRKDLDCAPCSLTECPSVECMKSITVWEVFEETVRLLKWKKGESAID